MMADKKSTKPNEDLNYIDSHVLINCRDTETNVPGKGCSGDNGVTNTVVATTDGLMFHQKDAQKITKCLTFDKLKFKSPSGAAFYLSVSDAGQAVFTPVEKAGDSR